jgi:aspartyl-tRNA(Asn)/glutamyl-tRNA(Gln) amidotransferase subunit C
MITISLRITFLYTMLISTFRFKGEQVKITESEVLHVARLARLTLDPEELAKFQKELSSILDYMDMLQEIDTKGIEPIFHAHSITNALRDDAVIQSQPSSDALRNAPMVHDELFIVPKVIE